MSLIFKICHLADWEKPEHIRAYGGSPKDREDGFLHFSTAAQLAETLALHYADAGDLLLVAVDARALGDRLRYEPSRGGALFPHLYGPLTYDTVKWVQAIHRDEAGKFILPERVGG